MNKSDLLESLQEEIVKAACDAKMETQLVMAMEKGLSADDFFVNCDSLFYREYNRDILYTDIKDDARKQQVLQLHLTRSGIYDHLPEGLFFQPPETAARNYNALDMAYDHRLNKQREEDLRRFFLPFENDFFLRRLQLEAEETRLLQGLQSGILDTYFMNFWGIPASIPRPFILPLILLLPYAHSIAGDLSLMAECLEKLLHEKINITVKHRAQLNTGSFVCQALGQQQLGASLVCGEQFFEDFPLLSFCIGPLENSVVSDYIAGGKLSSLLDTFFRFFVPAEADISTNIEVRPEARSMSIKTGSEPVLGYTSFL